MANGKHSRRAEENRLTAAEDWLERLARNSAIATGRPWAFLVALGVVIVWAASGPLFHFSDTWQLVINTGTTVVTFLMVFLIQRAQNRDTLAVQVKLAELIIAMKGAKNEVAMAEDMPEHELQALHDEHSEQAERHIDRLETEAAKAAANQ
jgi:low affinity Fe/Cu permease